MVESSALNDLHIVFCDFEVNKGLFFINEMNKVTKERFQNEEYHVYPAFLLVHVRPSADILYFFEGQCIYRTSLNT